MNVQALTGYAQNEEFTTIINPMKVCLGIADIYLVRK